jgi:glycolate oxidase FAD binding subunit
MEPVVSSKANFAASTLEDQLRSIVSTERVRAAGPEDSIAGVRARVIVEPANEKELASVLRLANADGLAVVPRGSGTKLGWGNPPKRADIILSTARLDKIIEHSWADLTVTVEAGCTIQKLQTALAQRGQRLALDPLWPDRATVGGVLSANDSGAWRLRFGSLRDLIIGATSALADGTLASSGGKVVKNVAGYDLQKLATGALGTLGVITRAIFRLHPLPANARTTTIFPPDLAAAQRTLLSIQDSKLAHTALQLRVSSDAQPQIDVLLEGTQTGITAQHEQLTKLVAPERIDETSPSVWQAREQLWPDSKSATTTDAPDSSNPHFAIAKISTLPASISTTVEVIHHLGLEHHLKWSAVVQALGIGWTRLQGDPSGVSPALESFRADVERSGGSLVVLDRSNSLISIEAWGTPSDSLPLMRAVKMQFDPAGTLNPGRFLGGI